MKRNTAKTTYWVLMIGTLVVFICVGSYRGLSGCIDRYEEQQALILADLMKDNDGDGFCNHDEKCDGEAKPGDCNDEINNVYPESKECTSLNMGDGVDNDCDKIVDNGCVDTDNDGDGYCASDTKCSGKYRFAGCESDECAEAVRVGDCDDKNKDINPDHREGERVQILLPVPNTNPQSVFSVTVLSSDGIDNNCDGVVDEGTSKVDDDGDGFCDHNTECEGEAKPGDCDDTSDKAYPGAVEGEVADNLDNDCNGKVDENALNVDHDGDGYCADDKMCVGTHSFVAGCRTESCKELVRPGDCDDTNKNIYPGAPEFVPEVTYVRGTEVKSRVKGTLDEIDNDCDKLVDNHTPFYDDDGDGYCEAETECLGEAVPGDCNDDEKLISPEGIEGELSDGIDNNCDGKIDEGVQDVDHDQDGYCAHKETCVGDAKPGDCDDLNSKVYPGAIEEGAYTTQGADGQNADGEQVTILPDEIDNDCDGIVDNHTSIFDDDGDGFCEHAEKCLGDAKPGDCNDADKAIAPGALEAAEDGSGDSVDNDCDGLVDEGTPEADIDGDGWTVRKLDCDDLNPFIHPEANEWDDGFDNDCDELVDGLDTLTATGDTLPYPERDASIKYEDYFVYPSSVFERRLAYWSYDHKVSLAAIDFDSGLLRLHSSKSTKPGVETINIRDKTVFELIELKGPYIVAKIKRTQSEPENIISEQFILLRFDARERSTRVSLKMEEAPRPALFVTSASPIDGLNRVYSGRYVLSGSSAGIAHVELAGDRVERTSLFLSECENVNCDKGDGTFGGTNYLGQVSVADYLPGEMSSDKDVVVSVDQLEVHDIVGCRDAYTSSRRGLASDRDASLEASYHLVQDACSRVLEVQALSFTLTFSE